MAQPSSFPPPHVFDPIRGHTHTIIALHDKFGTGPDFEVYLLKTPQGDTIRRRFPSWKWVFPSSNIRYADPDRHRHEWFDQSSNSQIEGLTASVRFVLDLLKQEAQLRPSLTHEHIILLGQGQGFVVGLLALMAGRERLCALIGMSGWLPECIDFEALKTAATTSIGMPDGLERKLGLPASPASEGTRATLTPVSLMHARDDVDVSTDLVKKVPPVLQKDLWIGDVELKLYGHGKHNFLNEWAFEDVEALFSSIVPA